MLFTIGVTLCHSQDQRSSPPSSAIRGTAVIAGRVLHANGKPAANIQVGAQMSSEARSKLFRSSRVAGGSKRTQGQYPKAVWDLTRTEATTDAQGRYRLAGL